MKISQGRPPNIEFTENYLAHFFGFLTWRTNVFDHFSRIFFNTREIIRIGATNNN